MNNLEQDKIEELLSRGVEKIYPNKEPLEKKLKEGKKLKIYCGYDPTGVSLHLGHAITLRKLSSFQALGHEVIMLIGDFTGMIGDPTGKLSARQKLTRERVLTNAKNYQTQASKILDFSGANPAKILYNSQWNDQMNFSEIIELASHFTVGQMIVRDMFQERMKENKPIYLHEFLYPLIQANDSVVMDIDVEIGGNDQTFNMLCGRELMREIKNKEKFVLTTKLLTDPSGNKMGKSEGNLVALDEPANNMFGQIMSWSDELIGVGFELCTDLPMAEISQILMEIKEGGLNPRDAKARLAKEIVAIHHNKKQAEEAEKEFSRVFKEKGAPSEIDIYKLLNKNYKLVDLLVEIKMAPSKSEARRLILQGGVKINQEITKDADKVVEIKDEMIIQVGKRKFAKIEIK